MRQFEQKRVTHASSSGLWGFVGAFIGVLFSHRFQKQRDRETQIRTVYARLHGLKQNLKQLYISRFEAYIYFDAHEAKWRNSNYTSVLDFSEATRWMQKSESLVFEIVKMEQALAESCGILLSFFRHNNEIVTKLKNLLSHSVPNIQNQSIMNWNSEKIDNWKEAAVVQLRTKVDDIFDKLFTDLFEDNAFKI